MSTHVCVSFQAYGIPDGAREESDLHQRRLYIQDDKQEDRLPHWRPDVEDVIVDSVREGAPARSSRSRIPDHAMAAAAVAKYGPAECGSFQIVANGPGDSVSADEQHAQKIISLRACFPDPESGRSSLGKDYIHLLWDSRIFSET